MKTPKDITAVEHDGLKVFMYPVPIDPDRLNYHVGIVASPGTWKYIRLTAFYEMKEFADKILGSTSAVHVVRSHELYELSFCSETEPSLQQRLQFLGQTLQYIRDNHVSLYCA